MICTFVVGQQVACINDHWWTGAGVRGIRPDERLPKKDGVYTISHIELVAVAGEVGLMFAELATARFFSWYNFRPVKKTDISLLEKLLVPAPTEKTPERV